jgi:protein-arginine deiminase
VSNNKKKFKGKSGKSKKVKWRPYLKLYADTDQTGAVDESKNEWKLRKKLPGAILVFNCDRDGATSPQLDFEDDDIKNGSELKDFSKLIVKKNKKLKKGYRAFLEVSSSDAKKVKVFDDFSVGGKACLGKLSAATKRRYELKDIRTRDYIFAVEAQKAVKNPGDMFVRLRGVIRKGKKKRFDTFVLFSIAPWLMLSNIEEADEVYVAETADNGLFRTALSGILGGKLHEISPSAGFLDRWMQDVIEVGFSSMPSTKNSPMVQFINSCNSAPPGPAPPVGSGRPSRVRLFTEIKKDLIGANYGHIEISQNGFKNLDSFGNLEVTPPNPKYPFGRIFYGVRDTSYGPGHSADEMSTEVVNMLKSNPYQPPVAVPTNWLSVGHVDEFIDFVPNLKGGPNDFRLLMASPKIAIKLCRKLKKAGRGSTEICPGKGAGYAITVNDFLNNTGNLLKVNLAIQNILNKIRRNIIRKKFNLPYVIGKDKIIGIPIIFNGTRLTKTKVNNAIARTAGMVNCLVVKPKVIVPKPFGPLDSAGKDVFEEYAKKKLEALGLDFEPVDDWDTYHILSGEIHCGTNAKRKPPTDWYWWKK